MKAARLILLISSIGLLVIEPGLGQELIINGKFENFSTCPGTISQFHVVENWWKPTPSTTDYFNRCNIDPPAHAGVPANMLGLQEPYSGDGYAGIFVFKPHDLKDYREYIQTKLVQPLVAGKKYCVSMQVSLTNAVLCSVDRIGMYFSQQAITTSGFTNISVVPQIESPLGARLIDSCRYLFPGCPTTGWMTVSGIYQAIGGEEFLTIGNFYDDLNTNVWDCDFSFISMNRSYYYIDDVSVMPMAQDLSFTLGADTSVCLEDIISIEAPGVNISYLWSTGQTTKSIDISTVGEYWVEVINESCLVGMDTIAISMKSKPRILLADMSFCHGETVAVSAGEFTDSVLWSNGAFNETIYLENEGNYWVEAWNRCGSSKENFWLHETNCFTGVANSFSPNNDGVNDIFLPVAFKPGETIIQFTVYNRWGQLVYECADGCMGWDGNGINRQCASGIYVWELHYLLNNESRLRTGSLTLLR